MSVNECELYCPFILTEYVVDDSFGLYSFFVLESGLILHMGSSARASLM